MRAARSLSEKRAVTRNASTLLVGQYCDGPGPVGAPHVLSKPNASGNARRANGRHGRSGARDDFRCQSQQARIVSLVAVSIC